MELLQQISQGRHLVFATILASSWVAGCGPKLPPARFVDSAAFHSMSGRVHGILEHDLDKDGRQDAIVAERLADGYAITVLRQEQGANGAEWHPRCASALVAGEDLDAMRWLSFGDKAVVFVLALTENPEEVIQSFALVDVGGGCSSVQSGQVKLERGDADGLIVPASLRRGVVLAEDGTAMSIVDQPEYLHLTGAQGDVRVLTSVRQRGIVWSSGEPVTSERRLSIIVPAKLKVRTGESSPGDASGAGDRDDDAPIHAAPGETLQLRLTAELPMLMLELHHGCDTGPAVLTLAAAGSAFTFGTPPAVESFVGGAGISREADGLQRDLIALRQETQEIILEVGPKDIERCLRQVRAFAFGAGAVHATSPRSTP